MKVLSAFCIIVGTIIGLAKTAYNGLAGTIMGVSNTEFLLLLGLGLLTSAAFVFMGIAGFKVKKTKRAKIGIIALAIGVVAAIANAIVTNDNPLWVVPLFILYAIAIALTVKKGKKKDGKVPAKNANPSEDSVA